jgi:hypothetical protein
VTLFPLCGITPRTIVFVRWVTYLCRCDHKLYLIIIRFFSKVATHYPSFASKQSHTHIHTEDVPFKKQPNNSCTVVRKWNHKQQKSKSFATVWEAFSSVYPDKEVPSKTNVIFLDTGSVCNGKHVWSQAMLTSEMPCNIEENERDCCFSTMGSQATLWSWLPYGKRFVINALLGVAFAQNDLQAIPHQLFLWYFFSR